MLCSYHFQTRKMGSCFSFIRPSIEIINEMPKGKQFDYLRPEGTITTYTVDRMYDDLEVELILMVGIRLVFAFGLNLTK